MLIDFIKMQAQGNDFVILDHPAPEILNADLKALAKAFCDRHFGFGADGLVILTDSETANGRMIIYNSDGSRAAMCGSALRCLSLLQHRRSGEVHFSLETDSGTRNCSFEHGTTTAVNMGEPELLEENKSVGAFKGSLVSVGNLHFVIFTDSLENAPHLKHGAFLERHPAFPRPVNVHFARIIDPENIELGIWETGAGPTLACGTGATASVLTGILKHDLKHSVKVHMPGGIVCVTMLPDGGEFELSGEVKEVGTGRYAWKI